ncbi:MULTISPECIES: hypothetical protein [unclassified Sphingomonas]|uniref:hypothetical protein n=1 Tax=unclassified Sphingomonas TaxID=196159 RepID=UPI0012E29FD3|nr:MULTISPECIES: hypothetical protein [unclassified Sphingomonas]
MDTHDRLSAEMVSRRQLALRFIKSYWSTNNCSPSYGEIAAGIGADHGRAREAVKSLVKAGIVNQQRGVPRSITLPTEEEAVLAALRQVGWRINAEIRELIPPTLSPLPIPAALDHIADVEGWDSDAAGISG